MSAVATKRKETEKVTIKELKVLGRYGKMFHDADLYPHSLRKLSKDVKKSDAGAIAIAALLLSQIITPNAVIIPIPQSSSIAEYTLAIAILIKNIRKDCEVADILTGTPRKKLYDIKKTRTSLKGVHTGLKVKQDDDCIEAIQSNDNVFFLDNIVNTGFSFSKARKALRKLVKIEPSLLAISATSNWFN